MCGILANRDRQVFLCFVGFLLVRESAREDGLVGSPSAKQMYRALKAQWCFGPGLSRPYTTQCVMSGIWGERKNMALRTHQNSSSPPKCSKPKFESGNWSWLGRSLGVFASGQLPNFLFSRNPEAVSPGKTTEASCLFPLEMKMSRNV